MSVERDFTESMTTHDAGFHDGQGPFHVVREGDGRYSVVDRRDGSSPCESFTATDSGRRLAHRQADHLNKTWPKHATSFHYDHGGWQVTCSICGNVGVPQEHQGDAVAIANRHEEVGGFER